MKTTVRISLAVLALGVFATATSAQTVGNVVWGALPGNGVTISGDWGMGINDDAKILGESAMYAGGRVGYSAQMFTIYGAGAYYPIGVEGVDGEVAFGGGVAVHVINKAEMPVSVSVQGGAGYVKSGDDTRLDFVGGPVIVINVPSTSVAVKPWVMPRVHYVKITDIDGEFGFGASGGLSVDLPMGVGFHAGVDWFTIGDPSIKPLTVGAGIHYTIKLPAGGNGGM
jgi:hypothetical protein